MNQDITVMGTGYVGLVLTACLADIGHEITAVDIDEDRIESLSAGQVPVYEPGLEEILSDSESGDRINFTSDWERALKGSDIIFIAVGTPKREDGSCDLRYVMNAAEMIGKSVDDDVTVVTKSTVPVGTGELIEDRINDQFTRRFESDNSIQLNIASNPEFLREGSAISDFKNPDRIVIGARDEDVHERLESLYEPIDAPVVTTELRTAEMIKYASNAMLATKISFINDIANVCEVVGADVNEVAEGVGMDNRINRQFLNSGIGYGGSCFPKDTEALVQIAGKGGYHSQILSSVMSVNQQQRKRFAHKILRHLPDELDSPSVAIWGLSFKPNTDDMREAPAIDIIQELQSEGVEVFAYDPEAMENAKDRLSGVVMGDSPIDAAQNTDAVALLTEWDEFTQIDFDALYSALNTPIIFDGRNVLPMETLVDEGFRYYGVGRGVDRLENILSNESLLNPQA